METSPSKVASTCYFDKYDDKYVDHTKISGELEVKSWYICDG